MNWGWVQHRGIKTPWREQGFQKSVASLSRSGGILRLQKIIPIRSRTTVLAVVRFFSDETVLLQIVDGTLNRGAGKGQLPGDGVQARPGDVVLVLPVVKVEINQLGSVWQVHAV